MDFSTIYIIQLDMTYYLQIHNTLDSSYLTCDVLVFVSFDQCQGYRGGIGDKNIKQQGNNFDSFRYLFPLKNIIPKI